MLTKEELEKRRAVHNKAIRKKEAEQLARGLTEEDIAERRESMRQSLAIVKLEGFEPSAEYLSDVEEYVQGKITGDELLTRSFEKTKAREEASENQGQRRAFS